MKTCPYCEAEIANNAKKCKHCGETVVEEKEVRLCPYCESELSDTAKKCKFCGEWLDKKVEYKCNNCGYMIKKGDKICSGCGSKLLREGIINSDRIHETKKESTKESLPDKRSDLNYKQKEILIKFFPLTGWYKVAVFFLPGIYLLYARRYRWYVLLFIPLFIPIVRQIAGIIICMNWESICYSKDAVNMKRTLMQYGQWNKEELKEKKRKE